MVGKGGFKGAYGVEHIDLSLYDLETDPAESVNLVKQHPEVVVKLKKMMAEFSADIIANQQPMGQYGVKAE